MTPERWRQITGLPRGRSRTQFGRAGGVRRGALRRRPEALRRDVESMLVAHLRGAGTFGETPAFAVWADPFGAESSLSHVKALAGTRLGPVRSRFAARRGRHGRRLSRHRHQAASRCGAESAAAGGRRRSRSARTVQPGSPGAGVAESSEHRAGPRPGRVEWCSRARHGAGRRPDAGRRNRRSLPFPVEEALQIAKQIAEALEASHERNIVHRDLKPANVKQRPDGTVKVLDFGLSKALDDRWVDGTLAETQNLFAMTHPARAWFYAPPASYMPPEQAKGNARHSTC